MTFDLTMSTMPVVSLMAGTGSLHSRVWFMSLLSSTGLIELRSKIGISNGLLQLVSVLNQTEAATQVFWCLYS